MAVSGKPYDATAKELIELDPSAWLRLLNISVSERVRIEVIDSDVSTLTAQADKVIRVDADPPWIGHFEFQASRDPALPGRLLRYNVLLDYRHQIPVRSVVVLLRPEAWSGGLIGELERRLPGGDAHLIFRYDVLRAWERRAEDLLAGGLATLPLLAISDVSGIGIDGAMADRLAKEAPPAQRAVLIASARVLMGLRFPDDEANRILGRIEMLDVLKIHGIEESTTYQAIFRKGEAKGRAEGKAEGKAEAKAEGEQMGKIEEASALLLRLGQKKFGEPDRRASAEIGSLDVLNRLESLLDRILDVSSWDELLAVPE